MDAEKLKRKAVERGVLSAADAARMAPGDAYNLIFAPGFSMAKQISGVSGRGVGMDVVKTNITRLNGTIELESEQGSGSQITIRLPLTLAIIGGLRVNVSEESYIIPLTAVIEGLIVPSSDIEVLREGKVTISRGKVLPLIELRETLDVPGEDGPTDPCHVVVVGLAERRVGLIVDRLLGQEEIVIKALNGVVGEARGIAGATILGGGTVIGRGAVIGGGAWITGSVSAGARIRTGAKD